MNSEKPVSKYRMFHMNGYWWVDTGDGTKKFQFRRIRSSKGVVFRTCTREPGVTFVATKEPAAWIELINVRMTMIDAELFVSD